MAGLSGVANSMLLVTIVQRVLPHYRVPFFRLLYAELEVRDIALRVVYGQERPGTVPATVPLDEPWAHRIRNRYLEVGGAEMVWQPCLRLTAHSALVVVEQSNRLLVNYPLLALRRTSRSQTKFAFWGHGRNMQSNQRGAAEWIKRRMIGAADWWFAYTSLSASAVVDSGYPANQVTTVQNSMDCTEFAAQLGAVTDDEVRAARQMHGITGQAVGLYCGSMYGHKNLSFLIAACVAIKKFVPEFSAVFVGDGPDKTQVLDATKDHGWIHVVGAKFGREKAIFFRMSSVLLMPGLVGLAIVDSFAAAIPIFTTDVPVHSPEIAYLKNGINGVMTPPIVGAYAGAVGAYLNDFEAQRAFHYECSRSAQEYTLGNMVSNFCAGITLCLGKPSDRSAK
jgi:glycosyltransferase involved in cell wall biosynthesis